jgi:hypothetical protein
MRSVLPILVATLLCCCDSDDGIPCDAPSFTLFVPAERAGDVARVSVSGQMCEDYEPACINHDADGHCTEWWIAPDESTSERGATCELEVTFQCALHPEGMTCAELAAGGGAGGGAGAGGASAGLGA